MRGTEVNEQKEAKDEEILNEQGWRRTQDEGREGHEGVRTVGGGEDECGG